MFISIALLLNKTAKNPWVKPISATSFVHPTDKAACTALAVQTVSTWKASGSYPAAHYDIKALVGELTHEARQPEPEFVEVPLKESY